MVGLRRRAAGHDITAAERHLPDLHVLDQLLQMLPRPVESAEAPNVRGVQHARPSSSGPPSSARPTCLRPRPPTPRGAASSPRSAGRPGTAGCRGRRRTGRRRRSARSRRPRRAPARIVTFSQPSQTMCSRATAAISGDSSMPTTPPPGPPCPAAGRSTGRSRSPRPGPPARSRAEAPRRPRGGRAGTPRCHARRSGRAHRRPLPPRIRCSWLAPAFGGPEVSTVTHSPHPRNGVCASRYGPPRPPQQPPGHSGSVPGGSPTHGCVAADARRDTWRVVTGHGRLAACASTAMSHEVAPERASTCVRRCHERAVPCGRMAPYPAATDAGRSMARVPRGRVAG